jgi:hypothetical protein
VGRQGVGRFDSAALAQRSVGSSQEGRPTRPACSAPLHARLGFCGSDPMMDERSGWLCVRIDDRTSRLLRFVSRARLRRPREAKLHARVGSCGAEAVVDGGSDPVEPRRWWMVGRILWSRGGGGWRVGSCGAEAVVDGGSGPVEPRRWWMEGRTRWSRGGGGWWVGSCGAEAVADGGSDPVEPRRWRMVGRILWSRSGGGWWVGVDPLSSHTTRQTICCSTNVA